jgi:uncharacterized MAPEG superfamily protein
MNAHAWPAVITLLNILLLLWVAGAAGRARGKYGVAAPATTGHPAFERAFRVQMNTLENTVIFLPALWLAAVYSSPLLAGAAGLVWLVGRVVYALAYYRDPAKRSAGFGISLLGFFVLYVAAGVGVTRTLYTI